MKLVLLRHGITDWNLEKRVQGRIDRPLCQIGRDQLMKVALPPEIRAYRWYCSPLLRARQTAELLGLSDFVLEQALVEMHWGEWEGEILKPLRKKLGDVMRDNESRGLDFQPPGGESPRQVLARLQPWFHQIAAAGIDCAAVVHKGIIRCIYAGATGWDMRGESPQNFAWDALHEFEFADDGELLDSYRSVPLNERDV